MNSFRLPVVKKFLLETFYAGLIISLPVFAWVRLIFFEVPFSISEDGSTLFKVVMTGWLMMILLKGSFNGIVLLAARLRRQKLARATVKWGVTTLAIAFLCSVLYACNAQSSGVSKDFNTGLTATYTNMEPERVLLVMNDEVLNHTDIPIGESFLLVNEHIKGLTVRDGKVSVGCSLTITDKNGKKILDEADLFKGNDVYNQKDADILKCTVNTGEPMKWEEKYDVVATFWDKYGTGKIVNKVTIRAIDIP